MMNKKTRSNAINKARELLGVENLNAAELVRMIYFKREGVLLKCSELCNIHFINKQLQSFTNVKSVKNKKKKRPKKALNNPRKSKQRKRARYKDSFYDSNAWRKTRYRALKLYGRKCLCCGGKPPNVELHVDHIKPRSIYPELELDIKNLQILCKECNLGKSNSDCNDYRK